MFGGDLPYAASNLMKEPKRCNHPESIKNLELRIPDHRYFCVVVFERKKIQPTRPFRTWPAKSLQICHAFQTQQPQQETILPRFVPRHASESHITSLSEKQNSPCSFQTFCSFWKYNAFVGQQTVCKHGSWYKCAEVKILEVRIVMCTALRVHTSCHQR